MNFKTYIQESFDTKPEKFKASKKGDDHIYDFSINGDPYKVYFAPESNYRWYLAFEQDSNLGITNKGVPYKVLITVIDIIRHFVNSNQINSIEFEADKFFTKNRANVYARLIKKFLPPTFEVKIISSSTQDIFFLINKNFKETEANK